MTYEASIRFLYELQLFGAMFGLEATRRLAALAGNPHERLRFIHVAGTNGKGSTCAMLEAIYRAAGLRVGLFTSPHLVSFRERMQINREWASEADVIDLIGRAQSWIANFSSQDHPTFFEAVTVMALAYFSEQKCDLVIWETGLGGRLDATNIVTPLASVIVTIDFDHEKWLGHTLAEIAREKAGIIKPRIPVITGESKPEPLRVITDTAIQNESALIVANIEEWKRASLNSLPFPLLGDHQRLNATVALATVRALSKQIPVGQESLRTGLSSVQWPGRMQIVRLGPSRTIILDGAHNPAGADSLRCALQGQFPGQRFSIVLGLFADKDWANMIRILAPLASRILVARPRSERAADTELLAALCHQAGPAAEIRRVAGVEEALEQTADDPLVVVTGSLHFVGEAIEALRLSPVPRPNERGLNEWGVTR